MVEAIEAADVDITSDYNDWYKIAIAIANTFGEQGRSMFHRISKLYIDYNSNEADKKYNQCLRNPNPQIRINTIYYYAKQAGVKLPHASQYAPFPHGAETAETAQTADFTHTSQYAPFTHDAQTAQTAQTTVVERFPIKALSGDKQLLAVLSGINRHYLLLSGIIRH